TLVGFWAIDEKPTGSKDPYALRRAALGLVRLVLDNNLRISFLKTIAFGTFGISGAFQRNLNTDSRPTKTESVHARSVELSQLILEGLLTGKDRDAHVLAQDIADKIFDLLAFFAERLKVQLREQGARHDLVDAVFALESADDLVTIVRRVDALG